MLPQSQTCGSPMHFGSRRLLSLVVAWSLIAFSYIPNGLCATVDLAKARLVAENIVRQHVSRYGDWNGVTDPSVGEGAAVQYQGASVAYNFTIVPSGHVLVAVDDTLSPVPLYSTRSSFNPDRTGQPQAMETWIVPEQHGKISGLNSRRAAGLQTTTLSASERISRAWDLYAEPSTRSTDQTTLTATAAATTTLARSATVAPLVTTAWGQDTPFNLLTPSDTGCTHTLTGCVATAWAQVLNYWEWPAQGTGSHSYTWNGETLSVDFSASTYDWANMGDAPDGSNDTENNAIAKLIYDLAVAAETDFGCSTSSSTMWADEVLDIYFKYKAMTFHDRLDYTATGWFALFQAELDADPPRVVIFSIFSEGGGHEVAVDGYQTGETDMVHINFGWPDSSDSYDGYYDVTDDFDAFYTWAAGEQYAVTGIEPDNQPPNVDAGNDQNVEEETVVLLSGSAVDPEGTGISEYQWTQLSGPSVTLEGASTASASFTGPNVHAQTTLIFQLRATDANRAFSVDTCTITIANTDGSSATTLTTTTDGGGGGGGCFIGSLN